LRPYNGIILKDNMSRRNLNGCHIRKLIRAGRGKSICITIPIEYIRDLNWKEHQEVIIERKGLYIVENLVKKNEVKKTKTILKALNWFINLFREKTNKIEYIYYRGQFFILKQSKNFRFKKKLR